MKKAYEAPTVTVQDFELEGMDSICYVYVSGSSDNDLGLFF